MTDIPFFDLTEQELEQIHLRYGLLEPLLDDYLSQKRKREHAEEVRQKLRISPRTLRRYLKRLREQGARGLARKKRSDAGQMRVFSPQILARAQELLVQNPCRSIPLLMELLRADPHVGEPMKSVSPSTLYHYLKEAGHQFRGRTPADQPAGIYRRFESEYPNQLWQGDARYGIPLPHPQKAGKTKMTYLFGWVDDFSRKLMEARYYWEEQLPRMEDCFRRAVLRWGLPERLYCDNGKVYLSRHFLILVTDLEIKKIHHPAYAAWCKGKIESVMKSLKRFQAEAVLAGFQTLEELNSSLAAWIEVEYNNKIHSSSGETPNERWRNNIGKHPPRRIKDIEAFDALFLWRVQRSIDKFGNVRFENNRYPVHGLPVGTEVQLRYNPFDLSQVHLYHKGCFYCTLRASQLSREAVRKVPQERKHRNFSAEAAEYFRRIREKATELKRQQAEQMRYADLQDRKENR